MDRLNLIRHNHLESISDAQALKKAYLVQLRELQEENAALRARAEQNKSVARKLDRDFEAELPPTRRSKLTLEAPASSFPPSSFDSPPPGLRRILALGAGSGGIVLAPIARPAASLLDVLQIDTALESALSGMAAGGTLHAAMSRYEEIRAQPSPHEMREGGCSNLRCLGCRVCKAVDKERMKAGARESPARVAPPAPPRVAPPAQKCECYLHSETCACPCCS